MADIVKRTLDQILPLDQRKEVLSLLGTGAAENAQEISEILGIDEAIIVELMNDDEFYMEVCKYTQADMRITHHTVGKATLKHVLKYGENKENPGRLKAYDRLARLVGADGPAVPPDINIFNIETALSDPKEKNVTPPKEEPLEAEFKRSLKNRVKEMPPRRVKGRMDNIPPLEEEVNGNIFEAIVEEEETTYDEDLLFRNSDELDLTQ